MLETVGIGWQTADEYVQNINKVTAEQVREVARKYLLEDTLTVAYLDPQPITETPKAGKSTGGRHAF
jgi:zinc protease